MSVREKETLVLLTKGYSARQISQMLSVTPNYVYSLIRMLKIRFNAHTNTGIVLNAIDENVIKPDGTLPEE